ncbi:MAG: ATP-binding protein [Spirochaetes bacterium]|nr:ATP-binding protein [Spirochaetota bacterium]
MKQQSTIFFPVKNILVFCIIITLLTMTALITFPILFLGFHFNFPSVLLSISIGYIPCMVMLLFSLIEKNNKRIYLFKRIFCYYYIVLVTFFVLVSGGIRSGILLLIIAVPIITYSLNENIILASILGFLIFTGFLTIYYFPKVDQKIMKIFLVQKNTELTFHIIYIMGFYIVYLLITFFCIFSKYNHQKYILIIEDKNKELEKNNQQKTNFCINISHEIKTPITLILNYANKLLISDPDNEGLNVIQKNAHKLTRDIINYLQIEKIKANPEFEQEPFSIVNLSIVLKQIVKLYPAKNFQLDIENQIFLKVDPYKIEMIVQNLISNALKYNQEDVLIKIILKKQLNTIHLVFQDNGKGIAKDKLPNLFNPFYQAGQFKKNIQGIGLGLSLVKTVVDSIGGSIAVQSEENQGTIFTLLLPLHHHNETEVVIDRLDDLQSIQELSTEIIEGKTMYNREKENIFILEDNKQLLIFLINSLQEQYNVYWATSGKEAMDRLEQLNPYYLPRVIISDIMMDGKDGTDFFNHLKKNNEYNYIPFIFLTAKNDLIAKNKLLNAGAIDYIAKPFDIDELKAKIKSNIDSREKLLDDFSQVKVRRSEFHKFCDQFSLSNKEKDVLELWIIKDMSYKNISENLNMTQRSVERYIASIKKKTGIFPKSKGDKTPFRRFLKDFI